MSLVRSLFYLENFRALSNHERARSVRVQSACVCVSVGGSTGSKSQNILDRIVIAFTVYCLHIQIKILKK